MYKSTRCRQVFCDAGHFSSRYDATALFNCFTANSFAPFTLAPFTFAPFTLAPFTFAPFTLNRMK